MLVRRDFQWMRTMAYEETSSVSVVSETVDAQRDEVEPKSVGEVLESSEVEESEAVAFLDKLNLKVFGFFMLFMSSGLFC